MGLLSSLFSYKGRMGRGAYIGCGVLINIVSSVPGVVRTYYHENGLGLPLWLSGLFVLFWVFMLWPISAVLVKRGHDRARPAWFSVVLLTLIMTTAAAIGATRYSAPAVAVICVLFAYQFVDYTCWPASTKAKRYGGTDGLLYSERPLVLS